jgi:predicted glycosyltransferase
LFIGGGGTINSEACFLGTPTISTRSFISHYDKYQIDNNLMVWVETKEELIKKAKLLIGTKVDTRAIKQMSIDIDDMIKNILS